MDCALFEAGAPALLKCGPLRAPAEMLYEQACAGAGQNSDIGHQGRRSSLASVFQSWVTCRSTLAKHVRNINYIGMKRLQAGMAKQKHSGNKVAARVLCTSCDEVEGTRLACSKQWLQAGVMCSPASKATPPLPF